MKEINGYLLCEVPENDEALYYWIGTDKKLYVSYGQIDDSVDDVILPKGNYSIIGLGKDLTEEQWKGIVDFIVESDGAPTPYTEFYEYYKNYCGNGKYIIATESGHSLLKANNLNPNTTLILKKIL